MDKNGAAQKLIAIFGHMDFIGLLHSILVETSKYIIIILFAIYTWHCFSVFVGNNTEKKDKVYRRQNKIMYTIHFICTLPETVCGVAVTPECVSAHDYAVYFGDGGGRDYGLFDLKDKLSYVSNDYRTQDLFRFGRGGIEFLDAPSNRVDTAKTTAFRRALAGAGFVSPASGAWAPADRTDAETLGYFMTDSRGGLFRMGMCGGAPEVERTKTRFLRD